MTTRHDIAELFSVAAQMLDSAAPDVTAEACAKAAAEKALQQLESRASARASRRPAAAEQELPS